MRYFDNDMDELFNKAGKEYPLNTGKKDWNAVQKALATEQEAPANASAGKNFKRFYPLLILLLLLPVLFYVLDNRADRIARNNTSKANAGSNPTISTNSTANTNPTPNTNAASNTNNNTTNNNTSNNTTSNSQRANNITINNNATNSNTTNTNTTNSNTTNNNAINNNTSNNNASNNITSNSNTTNTNSANPLTLNNNPSSKNITDKKNLKPSLFPFKQPTANFTKPYACVPEPQIKDEPAATPQSTKPKLNKRQPSFYYGVMAGPDFSTIKYQDIKNIGSGVGLLLGYRFSNHWSVEASGFWSTKKYFTDGKYFDKANANVPAYVELYFLDGGCQMVELPIDVRYEFTPGKNSFFMTAGLNSYFMKKESYDYKADASGSVYDGHRNYTNSGSNIFSNLQLSGGYQHKLFSKFVIRIEPYLQVPLREVGIGKMPITSAGVHIGLVRETK